METRAPKRPTRRPLIAAAVVAIIAIAVAVVALIVSDDDGDETSTDATTSIPAATSTTSSPSSTRPTSLTSEEAAYVVWPWPDGDTRFDDPLAVAEDFAVELVGFRSPVIEALREGDSRSGEVPVRAQADGPETTVLVRQLSDGNWWVLGATTESIELDDPIAVTAIDNPLLLAGRARAFEGTVLVAVYERGSTTPLGEGFVTASGTEELGPFTGEIPWDNPGGGWGVVLLHTESAENGQVWEATAVPVGFIGGD